MPAFRNLYTAVKEELGKTPLPEKGSSLPRMVEDALVRMLGDYERIRQVYEARGITPILIVVADTIKNAERLFAELGGWRGNKGKWVQGRFSILSNADDMGRVKSEPPTLLVHSRMDETEKDEKLAGKVSESDNSAVHAPDETMSAAERMNVVRALFNTAGKKGEPGEHLRCIVSVGMLTEGWDAKAVTHVVGYRSFGSDLLCEQVAGRALRRSVVPEPGVDQTAEYANIVGIPFLNMQATEKGDPGYSKERWAVYTVPGRADQRLELPRVRGWRRDQPGPRASLRTPLDKLKARPVGGTGEVSLLGEGGKELTLSPEDAEREQTARWRLAVRVLDRCKVDYNLEPSLSRLESFASVVRAVEAYLKTRGIRATQLTTEANIQVVSADIAKHLVWSDTQARIIAAMDSPDHAILAGLHFETTLLRYPEREGNLTARSELNAAACHSDFERQVARLLDRLEGVDAWVRNFRLGWTIPWHDPIHARWHEYEPDFVARVGPKTSFELPGHLVIEVKGEPDVRSDEKARAAREWCRRLTNGAVSGVKWQMGVRNDRQPCKGRERAVCRNRATTRRRPIDKEKSCRKASEKARGYRHASAKRARAPSEEDRQIMPDGDVKNVPYWPQPRAEAGAPRLSWQRGNALEKPTAAAPLYIQERIHPSEFVQGLTKDQARRQTRVAFRGVQQPAGRRAIPVVSAPGELEQPPYPRTQP